MIDLFILMVAFARLGILNGWILGLMIVKTIWEVFKIAIICGSQGKKY